jgi:hypothetical protein
VRFLNNNDFAKEILLESVLADHVGQAIDVIAEPSDSDEIAIKSYSYECKSPAYPGWYWAVTVVEVTGQSEKTVSEINLLPGTSALVPKSWKPWADRIQAGDLGIGDVLPTDENDSRLTAGFTANDELEKDFKELHPNQWELGLGREQVLSAQGLELAVDRWYSGDNGPRSAMAKAAPASCSSCGFLTPIGGSLGQAFGICANEYGAADGHIVAMNFGCGAHSSVRAEVRALVPVVGLVVDEITDDLQEVSDADAFDDNPDSDLVAQDEEKEFHDAAIIDVVESMVEHE